MAESVTLGMDWGKINRDEEWVEFVGGALHTIEVFAHGGTGEVSHQAQLLWEFRPEEMLPAPPPVTGGPDGKVPVEQIVQINEWVMSTHPVWTLKVVEQEWVERGAVNTGGEGLGPPVLVVDLLERHLADLGRRLWLHPWYRKLCGLDDLGHMEEPGRTKMARAMARKRKRVERDLEEEAARWPRSPRPPQAPGGGGVVRAN